MFTDIISIKIEREPVYYLTNPRRRPLIFVTRTWSSLTAKLPSVKFLFDDFWIFDDTLWDFTKVKRQSRKENLKYTLFLKGRPLQRDNDKTWMEDFSSTFMVIWWNCRYRSNYFWRIWFKESELEYWLSLDFIRLVLTWMIFHGQTLFCLFLIIRVLFPTKMAKCNWHGLISIKLVNKF